MKKHVNFNLQEQAQLVGQKIVGLSRVSGSDERYVLQTKDWHFAFQPRAPLEPSDRQAVDLGIASEKDFSEAQAAQSLECKRRYHACIVKNMAEWRLSQPRLVEFMLRERRLIAESREVRDHYSQRLKGYQAELLTADNVQGVVTQVLETRDEAESALLAFLGEDASVLWIRESWKGTTLPEELEALTS